MNVFALIAGIIALAATIGHFTMGTKMYLKPVLNSDLDPVVKKVVQSFFHYSSVFLILTSFTLIMSGIRGSECELDSKTLFGFVGFNYAMFAVWQLIIALTSKIPGAPFKMFQWIFWVLIAVFCFLAI
jgi:hypothetical protein